MNHPPVSPRDFKRLDVSVEVRDDKNDRLVAHFRVNLANDGERRYFAEQMTNAYSGGQYSIVSPITAIKVLP